MFTNTNNKEQGLQQLKGIHQIQVNGVIQNLIREIRAYKAQGEDYIKSIANFKREQALKKQEEQQRLLQQQQQQELEKAKQEQIAKQQEKMVEQQNAVNQVSYNNKKVFDNFSNRFTSFF